MKPAPTASAAAALLALASLSLAEADDGAAVTAVEAVDSAGRRSATADRRSKTRRRLRRTDEFGGQRGGRSEQEVAAPGDRGAKRELAKLSREQRRRRRRRPPQPPQQSSSTNSSSAPGCGPTPGTHRSPYLGCYADRSSDRAFPFELHAASSRALRLGHGALDCERECTKRGYRYFGREFRGQCFCGNEWSEIGRYGKAGGCDCCGNNVGANRMCVWENADHPDSQAAPPDIPVLTPAQARPVSQPASPPTHAHMSAASASFGSHSYSASFGSSYTSNYHYASSSSSGGVQPPQNANPANVSARKPLGAFRLRLHWQFDYRWQGSSKERFWCMECRGGCSEHNSLQISHCGSEGRQKFIAVQRTIRPATNPSLCATVSGYGGTDAPLTLRRCNRSSTQNFDEIRAAGTFELQPEGKHGRCVSQHHHPKDHEAVFPETCEKTRRFHTTLWTTF